MRPVRSRGQRAAQRAALIACRMDEPGQGDQPRRVAGPGAPGRWSSVFAFIVAAAVLALPACGSPTAAPAPPAGHTQRFTDTAGRAVTVPTHIARVATVGYVTTLDSLLYMVGAQDLIINGIPAAGETTFLTPYKDLAPQLLALPTVEPTINGALDGEALLALRPDIVITSDPAKADQVQNLGIPAVVIFDLGTETAIEHDVNLTGQLLGRQPAATAYTHYADTIIDQVTHRVATIPAAGRPSALYADFGPLTQPTTVEGWIFGVLGARNVVTGTVPNHFAFTDEQVLTWNPDYIVVQRAADLPQFTHNPAFATLGAVRAGHVKQIPSGFNIWGDNTVEEPLGVLWTAQYLYPQLFADINLAQETGNFYTKFFGVRLSPEQITRLLNAGGLS